MKEKIKNFFTNKTFWEYIIGFFVLIILLSVSYSKGFVDGVLIDDEIRTELIDTTLDETKKSKIEPKKAGVSSSDSAFELSDVVSKVYFFIDDEIRYSFNYFTDFVAFDTYYFYDGAFNDDYLLYYIEYNDERYFSDFFTIGFELFLNGIEHSFLAQIEQGDVTNVSFTGIFEEYISNPPYSFEFFVGSVQGAFDDIYLLTDNIYFYNNTASISTDYNFFANYVYLYDVQTPKSFLSEFLSGAVEVVTGFGAVLTASVVGIGSIFYSNGQLTIVGSAMALALGIGAIYLLFRMIRGLIKQNNRG